jgi:hypothetical protein
LDVALLANTAAMLFDVTAKGVDSAHTSS